jgi:hypothetical protein
MSADGTMSWWIGLCLAAVFAVLGLLHLYWAAGGRRGKSVSIPMVDGQWAFHPLPGATVLVAGVLFTEMLIVLGQIGWWGDALPWGIFQWGTWGIVVVFGLRALGEFRLVGFFKRVRHTEFARWDTWLFTPLCLAIALLALLLT